MKEIQVVAHLRLGEYDTRQYGSSRTRFHCAAAEDIDPSVFIFFTRSANRSDQREEEILQKTLPYPLSYDVCE